MHQYVIISKTIIFQVASEAYTHEHNGSRKRNYLLFTNNTKPVTHLIILQSHATLI